jgi:hypothetical protein
MFHQRDSLTFRQCAAVLAVLTAMATVTAALLWGTGCATQHDVAVLPVEKIEVVGNVSLSESNPSHPLEVNREK